MKIPAPNYTQTPNVFFDHIMKDLKEGELRVVLILMRQTFGWHKDWDRISLSQIAEKTGMERKSVCRSINSLIEKGLVQKKKFGAAGRERCYYSLVVEQAPVEELDPDDGIETEEEMALISNISDQCPNDARVVSLGRQTSVLMTPTKERLTKETIQKKAAANACASARGAPAPAAAADAAAASFEDKKQERTETPLPASISPQENLRPTRDISRAPEVCAAPSCAPPAKRPASPPVKASKPKVYACLVDIAIDDKDKIWITEKHEELTVVNAVDATLSRKIPPKNMAAFLKYACAEGLVPEPSQEDKEEAHREYAKQLEREIVNSQYVRVDFMSKAIEFVFLNSVKEPIEVKYCDAGFIGTVEGYIQKFNLVRRKE